VPVAGEHEGKSQQPPAVARRELLELRLIPARYAPVLSSSPHLRNNDPPRRRVVLRGQRHDIRWRTPALVGRLTRMPGHPQVIRELRGPR